jgi:tetratricopeptide (TPR) repeat protein
MRFARPLSASRAWFLLLAYLSLAFSLPAQETSKQEDQETRNELQGPLREARDAVVRLAAQDSSSLDTSISEKVNHLVKSLLYVGDRDDVRYLQHHLKRVYADEIRSALEPSATLQDFASRVSKASRVKDVYEHDKELETIVSQEIERGFIEDAVSAAERIRLPGSRSTAFIDIALAQHAKGSDSAADEAVTAAIHACFQPGTGLPLIIEPPDRQLTGVAAALASGGYPEGAQRALAEAEKAVEAKAKPDSFDWSNLTQGAIAVGDLPSAAHFLQKVEGDEARADLQTKLDVAQARQAGPDAVVRTAIKISDPWVETSVLRDIANKQSEAGDSDGATITLRLALEAANRAHERTVLLLHDMAWAQIEAGDRLGAEHTLELALQENEKPAFGQDQVDGWALLADTFAFLGHFDRAHKIASKISDHYSRGRVLGFIAEREVAAGHSEEALAWAKQLNDPDERASAYLAIVETTIEKLKDDSKK